MDGIVFSEISLKSQAPEALSERIYNRKTDVWSSGVVIYEILTKRVPYAGKDSATAAVGIMNGNLSLMQEIEREQSQYPEILVHLMKQSLQYDAAERPTFREIVKIFDSDYVVFNQ